jgi:DNA-directed RNA polymerase subunit K/omega
MSELDALNDEPREPEATLEAAPVEPAEPEEPIEYPKGDPIESRFLYVDVAAMRAKQIRRGARVRLAPDQPRPLKPERIAMEEVRHQLVLWSLPEFKVEVDLR